MSVNKAQKHPKKAGVVDCQTSADIDTTSPGIHASQDDIRMCAYYIYEKRGSAHGYDTQDWAQAERLIAQH
jgi:hypothetical protein